MLFTLMGSLFHITPALCLNEFHPCAVLMFDRFLLNICNFFYSFFYFFYVNVAFMLKVSNISLFILCKAMG